MKKLGVLMLFVSSLFFFVGCQKSQQNTIDTIQQIQDTLPTLVQQLNDIQKLEAKLQDDWEAEIAVNASMEHFSSEKGLVFENIQTRKQLVKQAKEAITRLSLFNQQLIKVSNQKNMVSEVRIVTNTLTQIVTDAQKYLELYSPQIEKEFFFFKELAKHPQDFEFLNQHIVEINQSAIERQHIVESLNEPLKNIDKPIRIAKVRLSAQMKK